PALSPTGTTGGDETLILRKLLLDVWGKLDSRLILVAFAVGMTIVLGALSLLW
ncbi:MAG: hypothetical protein ACI8RZ_002985, partial [Myxococcota bacterium]